MAKFLLRRVIFLTLTLIFVSIAIFAITELAPGNIAVNTLGNTITPEQEASFNAQNGLDQSPTERYIRFIFGSDWQVEDDIGFPVTRVFNEDTQRCDEPENVKGCEDYYKTLEEENIFPNKPTDKA